MAEVSLQPRQDQACRQQAMPPPAHRAPTRAAPPAGPPTASSTRSVTSAMRRWERPPRRRTGLEYPRVRPLDAGACGRRAVRSARAGGATAARAAVTLLHPPARGQGCSGAAARSTRCAPSARARGQRPGRGASAGPGQSSGARPRRRTPRDAGEELECARRARGRDRSQRERCARAGRRAPGGRLRQPAPRNVLRRIKAAASRAIESTMAPR
jgi:hypothetical protein